MAYIRNRSEELTGFQDSAPYRPVTDFATDFAMVYGTDDTVVKYPQHGQLLEDVYADHPGLLTIMKRPSQGHHPHGFPQHPEKIADWIEAHMN